MGKKLTLKSLQLRDKVGLQCTYLVMFTLGNVHFST